MDSITTGRWLQLGATVLVLVVAWFLIRQLRKQTLGSDAAFAYTPDMVEPHRRLVALCERLPRGTWLHTADGYRLRVNRMTSRLSVYYDIERLTPDTWMLVPGEQAVHESYITMDRTPPVFRRTRALYANEQGLHTVDEEPIKNMDEFRDKLLPAMIVDVDDLTVLADQLEHATPRAEEPGE